MANDFIKIKKKIFMGEARERRKEFLQKKILFRRKGSLPVSLFFL